MAGIFILAIFITSCASKSEFTETSISYKDDKPVALKVPVSLFPAEKIDSKKIRLTLSSSDSKTPVLGTFETHDHFVYFTPLIPLKRTFTYEVYYDATLIDQFTIPESNIPQSIPELIAIYPSVDTVPENLLKVHLKFSEKMSVIPSSNYVCMLNSAGDTLDHIFLQLEPELWNLEQTILTLWIEPGRIKEGLLPNLLDGIPIEKGNTYTIAVSGDWKSAKGVSLKYPVRKTLFVGERDKKVPLVDTWEMAIPPENTGGLLKIKFGEALDYTSVIGSFVIYTGDMEEIPGKYIVSKYERGIEFVPQHRWKAGSYTIHIDGSVEDLAANSLNRLFDRDLQKDSTKILATDKEIKFDVD